MHLKSLVSRPLKSKTQQYVKSNQIKSNQIKSTIFSEMGKKCKNVLANANINGGQKQKVIVLVMAFLHPFTTILPFGQTLFIQICAQESENLTSPLLLQQLLKSAFVSRNRACALEQSYLAANFEIFTLQW